jgi:hypothetical protein
MCEANRFACVALGALAFLSVVGGSVAYAADARAPSPAASAKQPSNRGRVVGAACSAKDGYVPDFSSLRGKAAKDLEKGVPVNLVTYVDAKTPLPIQEHQLPPGVLYCIEGPSYPDGYLTSNCQADIDCPTPATCSRGQCRASCDDDGDCLTPAVCVKANSAGYCRCDSCVSEGEMVESKFTRDRADQPRQRRHGKGSHGKKKVPTR